MQPKKNLMMDHSGSSSFGRMKRSRSYSEHFEMLTNETQKPVEPARSRRITSESTVSMLSNNNSEHFQAAIESARNDLISRQTETTTGKVHGFKVPEKQEDVTTATERKVNRTTFNTVSKHAELQLDKAKNIFLACLAHGNFLAGPHTAEIIRFHLVPRCRSQLNIFIRKHGCFPYNTIAPLSEIKQKKCHGRKTPVWFTSVTFTDHAQREYFLLCRNSNAALPDFCPQVLQYLSNPYPDSIKDMLPEADDLDELGQIVHKRSKNDNPSKEPQRIIYHVPLVVYHIANIPSHLNGAPQHLAAINQAQTAALPSHFMTDFRPHVIVSSSPHSSLQNNTQINHVKHDVQNVSMPVVVPPSPVFQMAPKANSQSADYRLPSGEPVVFAGHDLTKYSKKTLFEFLKPHAELPPLSGPSNSQNEGNSNSFPSQTRSSTRSSILNQAENGSSLISGNATQQMIAPNRGEISTREDETSELNDQVMIPWQDFINTEHYETDHTRPNPFGYFTNVRNQDPNGSQLPSSMINGGNSERNRKTPPSREDIYSFPPLRPDNEN